MLSVLWSQAVVLSHGVRGLNKEVEPTDIFQMTVSIEEREIERVWFFFNVFISCFPHGYIKDASEFGLSPKLSYSITVYD